MNPAKIRLSAKEMELVLNADWILTKNAILQKVKTILENQVIVQQEIIQAQTKHLPHEVYNTTPKISKGENYKGLPYLVLDYPRYFDKENVFAIRTMFWWGHFFSITLQLSGKYKTAYQKKLTDRFRSMQEADFSICVHESEWEHHFEESNYRPVTGMDQEEWKVLIAGKPFLKLAKKIPLQEWENKEGIEALLVRYYFALAELLGND